MKLLSSIPAILAVFVLSKHIPTIASPDLPTHAPSSIELQDQYEAPQRLTFPSPSMTVLTLADRKGSEQVNGWISSLKARYGAKIHLCGIANVSGAPRLFHGMIRRKFQEKLPYPIMMDWSGSVFAQFRCEEDVATILVLDQSGAILSRFSGVANRSRIAKVFALLDPLVQNPYNNSTATESDLK